MTSLQILDAASPNTESPEYRRLVSVTKKLTDAGFPISHMEAAESENPAVKRLLEQNGTKILPIVLVNNFPMITGRYPTNDELKQILAVPDGIIEPKHCGCCCIEGCGCE